MLDIGNKVVYPMHGAGVIEAIEEREVLGESHKYYVLSMSYGGMRVLIPVNNVDKCGLREIIEKDEIREVEDVLRQPASIDSTSWNRRFNANLSKIKSGNIFDVAEVVRNLMQQDKIKKLSTAERRLLSTARHILVSEIVLACSKDLETVENWLDRIMDNMTPAN